MREVLGNDPKMREPNAIQPACIEAMRAVAAQKIELFGAAGKGSSARRRAPHHRRARRHVRRRLSRRARQEGSLTTVETVHATGRNVLPRRPPDRRVPRPCRSARPSRGSGGSLTSRSSSTRPPIHERGHALKAADARDCPDLASDVQGRTMRVVSAQLPPRTPDQVSDQQVSRNLCTGLTCLCWSWAVGS
jgi:hypothetical protein